MKKLFSVVLALALLLSCVSMAASGEDKVYNVGVLQLLPHPALDAATEGFKAALTEKLGDKVKFDVQNAAGESANCAVIANTFVSSNVDLILANATAALQACVAATGDIPVLGTSITDYATALDMADFSGVSGINVSGTTDLAPLDGQAQMVKELFPEAKTVGLIYCSAEPNSIYQVKTISGYLAEMGLECKEFAFSDSNDIAAIVQNAVDSCDVLYIPTDNTAANNTELIANIVLPAKCPVIAGEEGICKGCGVATLTIDYFDIGHDAGLMAYDILVNGADITTMPVKAAPKFTKKYNAANAAELGVTIPEGYEPIED